MATSTYDLSQFVYTLRAITAKTQAYPEIIHRVCPLAQRLALSRAWLAPGHYVCNSEHGFGVHLLHEEPNHTLAVVAIAWLPDRGAPPHNHGTWAVVVGVDGTETHTFWQRLDEGTRPGYAELSRRGTHAFGHGEVVAFLPEEIHSIVNETQAVTVSLHVYGRDLNDTSRAQFDPAMHTETPCNVREETGERRLVDEP